MDLKTYGQLRKLMMLTFSDSDAEALSALRKANAVLKAHGYDWDSAFNRLVKVEEPVVAAAPEQSEAERIREAFDDVEASDPRGSFADFIASLKEQWEANGRLSQNQKDALFKAASSARGRRR